MSYSAQENETALKDRELQLVGFCLGSEEYGVDILKVQEINRMLSINKIPNAPHFVEGMINLRGKVLTVIDLRERFGLEKKEKNKQTRIMVVNIGTKTVGMMVDAVTEVLRVSRDTVEPPPAVVTNKGMDYISGVGKIGERLLILLDLEKLLQGMERELQEVVLPEKGLAS